MNKDIKQLLLDKLDVAETLHKNSATVFSGELKEILKYIQYLEEKIKNGVSDEK